MRKLLVIFGMLIAAPFAVVLIVTIAYYAAECFLGEAWSRYWTVRTMGEVYKDRRRGL